VTVRKLSRKTRRNDLDKSVKSLEKDITGPQRREFRIFKKTATSENDKLNINHISEEDWITHHTKLGREDKAQGNLIYHILKIWRWVTQQRKL
jgi:hypothetical protein